MLANLNDCLSSREHLLSFVKTDVKKLNQIVNRSRGQAIDVIDSVFREGIRLLRGHAFNRGEGNRRAGCDHRAHRFSNFLLQFFFAADIDVPANEFGGEPYVLTSLTNREAELIFVYDHFHLTIFDVRDAHLIHFRGR